MKRRGYMVVEGPHDIEFVARLLKPYGFGRIQYLTNLDSFWKEGNFIPNRFPYRDDLLKRVPVPTFFETLTHSIAIHSASGYTRIAETIQETIASLPPNGLESIGIILDADSQETVFARFDNLKTELRDKNPDLALPVDLGQVTQLAPKLGIYILPDNQESGTLESILLDAGMVNYPQLHSLADQYVQTVQQNELTKDDLEEIKKPAGRKKAQIGSMASILRPGKAIQVSIQDNRWLEGEALNLPKIKAVSTFLAELFQLG